METSTNCTESLNGITLLRYTHAFESGGGIENYLNDCNRILLERNEMTIIQIFYADKNTDFTEKEQLSGKGRLINIAVPRHNKHIITSVRQEIDSAIPKRVLQFARDSLLNNYISQRCINSIKRRYINKISNLNVDDQLKTCKNIFKKYNVDLISFHCFGTADTSQVIDYAITRNIPFFYLNHYSNNKFNERLVKKQLVFANGIAGVSICGVPDSLRNRFVSLYDGIDTSYFSRENASPVSLPHCNGPVIFLPARICEGKGHRDILKIASALKEENIPIHILFAGRTDSPEFNSQLHLIIKQNNLSDCVTFLDHCDRDEIRNLYAISSVVVLPSKNEGFGRILIEAQSMSVPVVAYNVGGTSQTLLNGKSGYLCKYGDVAGLYTSIKKILINPDLRESMAKAARNYIVQEFTLERLAYRHESYYQNVLKHKNL